MQSDTKASLIAVVLCFFFGQFGSLTCLAQASKAQTTYCEDGWGDDVSIKPVPIPQAVLNAVMNSEQAREARASATSEGNELQPEKLLQGTTIKLSSDQAKTFLLMGSVPLSGGDNTWFWIVRESGGRASVLVWVGALCVEVKRTSNLGYRDVVGTWSSAAVERSESYRYDGRAYRLIRRRSRSRGRNDF